MGDSFNLTGEFKGHAGWVTSLAVSESDPSLLVSGSRDKSVMVWRVSRAGNVIEGKAMRSLHGHSHFVSDVTLSQDGQYCLSASWDATLRLWYIGPPPGGEPGTISGECKYQFKGHTKDCLSVAFSPDNRQIVSGSRDHTIKLWNVIGECKFTISPTPGAAGMPHNDWVSCVRYSPNTETPQVVSAGWDKLVCVTSILNLRDRRTLKGHTGYLNTVTVSPDGSLCASGGKDGIAMLWDLSEGKSLYELQANSIINALVFSPNRYWLCAATTKNIIIWDLENKRQVSELPYPNADQIGEKALKPFATSLAWSSDGNTLYSGWTDNVIRVHSVTSN
jgi:guanine nucleotide-binding protein subunit beta-2-like 1 protein